MGVIDIDLYKIVTYEWVTISDKEGDVCINTSTHSPITVVVNHKSRQRNHMDKKPDVMIWALFCEKKTSKNMYVALISVVETNSIVNLVSHKFIKVHWKKPVTLFSSSILACG